MAAYVVLALANLLLLYWKTTTGVYLSVVLFGMTAFAIPAIMAAAAGDVAGARLAPAALGFITIFFGIGQALGPAVAGWLKDTTGTFSNAFVLAACVAVLGAAASTILADGEKSGESARRRDAAEEISKRDSRSVFGSAVSK
jgi:sugar phosphate permease